MSNLNIKVDLSPYLPDTYLKHDIYKSLDKVDYTSYISINTTIFIFNIKCSQDEYKYYNDPEYLLYGIKKTQDSSPNIDFDYQVPSTFFFNYKDSNIENLLKPYVELENENIINPILIDLLNKIGYDVNLLEYVYGSSPNLILNFTYKELECYDSITDTKKRIIYLFFNIKNLEEINYNNYNSTVYYQKKYYNIFIYPFIFTNEKILSLNRNNNLFYNKNNYISKSINYIDLVDFDDKDLIKYFEKIDYKYMERRKNYLSTSNKLDLLINLSKNYKLYEDFFTISQNNKSIIISNNEISKTYYANLDYENKNLNSYTLSILNNNYVNNYLSYSGKEKQYSFTIDGKISYVKRLLELNKFKYSPYNCSILNIPSIYQMSKNYYINTYINLNYKNIVELSNELSNELLLETNTYLYKTLIAINPNLINLLYLISPDVKLSIHSLFQDCNQLNFGSSINKINLFFENTIKTSETFYVDKYKIIFNFKINDSEVSYVIILGICFYNGKNLNVTNTSITRNTDDLAYILFTNQDNSVSLCPQLYNLNELVKVYEDNDVINLYEIKNFKMLIDYNNLGEQFNYKDSLFNSFYTFIPFIQPIIVDYIQKTNNINGSIILSNPNPITNLFDINITKINNYIKNLINLSENIIELVDNDLILTFMNTLNYDFNLELYGKKYVYNYGYFPEVQLNSFLPNTINKYKLFNDIPETKNTLVSLPAGNYKVLKYKNFFPKYLFETTTKDNDLLILTINTINKFLNLDFLLFIKLPNNYVIDDKFIVDLNSSDKEYYLDRTNYSCNIGPSETQIFLVVSKKNGDPYVNSENIINGLELFSFYNQAYGINIPDNKYKIRLNLFFCTYLNFYQMILLSTVFTIYSENRNSLLDIDNSKLLLHNRVLLKDIVYYDFIRFNYLGEEDLKIVKQQYDTYNSKITDILYDSKYYANLIKINITRLVFIANTNKIIIYLKKAYYYLKNYLLIEEKNIMYIQLINWIGQVCLNITQINYSLGTTFSINNDYTQNYLILLKNITLLTSFESINDLIKNTEYIIYFFQEKIILTSKQIINDYNIIIDTPNINIDVKDEFIKIHDFLFKYELNILIIDQLSIKINNLLTSDIIQTVSIKYTNIDDIEIRLLINIVINFLHLVSLNSKKIDELINTVRIIYEDKTVDTLFTDLNNNVVKNMFLYNTDYYNSLKIKNFNIDKFLNDYIICIKYFANPNNSSQTSHLYYLKSINENIINYINNTIKYLNLINIQIIGIYKYIYDIDIGIISKVDITKSDNIANMYYLLTVFKENYFNMNKIINENKINIFQEFNLVIDFFNEYIISIIDFLFYIEIKLYFSKLSTFNENLFLDILKILEISEFYTLINEIIQFINQISLGNTTIINEFITNAYDSNNFELKNPIEELAELKSIISNYNYQNKNIYSILKKYILNSYIVTNKIQNFDGLILNITYQGQEIIIIRDYNILYYNLSNSSFNFDLYLISIVKNSIDYQISILDYYYESDESNNLFYKQLINYNYLYIGYIVNNTNNLDNIV